MRKQLSNLATVKALIGTLNADDCRQIVDDLQGRMVLLKRPVSVDGQDVYEAMRAAMADKRIGPLRSQPPFLAKLTQTIGVKTFERAAETMRDYVTESAGVLRKPVRLALYHECFILLILYLDMIGVPISASSIMQNIRFVRQGVDEQFPGYAEGRLLHRICLCRP
jgi:hypothetical protein